MVSGGSLMTMTVGPCAPYVTADDILECEDCATGISEARADVAASVASRVMFLATGRKFPGSCEIVGRPCGCNHCAGFYQDMGWGVIIGPGGSYTCGGACGEQCGCTWLSQLDLGDWLPVQTISEVKVDGVVLDPSDYRLDDNRYLVRVDGDSWPTCQNLTLADTEIGTWSVTFTWGLDASDLVVEGTRALACEIAKACTPGTKCALPQRITSITRQGMSAAFIDPQEFLTAAPGQPVRTGIYLADLAIAQENPHGLDSEPAFINPDDMHPTLRRAGT